MTSLPLAPRIGQAATDYALARVKRGERVPVGTCLMQTRENPGVPAHDYTPGNGRDPWAIEAWEHAHFRHLETNPAKIPPHVTVFYRGASGRPGHVVWGIGEARCVGTDIPGAGDYKVYDLLAPVRLWGMTLLGWTEDLNEYRIWEKPVTPPKKKSRGARIDEMIRLGTVIVDKGNRNAADTERVKKALVELKKIPLR
jgi:hypothetical protein